MFSDHSVTAEHCLLLMQLQRHLDLLHTLTMDANGNGSNCLSHYLHDVSTTTTS